MGRHLTGDCELDCQHACAYPGRFSECDQGTVEVMVTHVWYPFPNWPNFPHMNIQRPRKPVAASELNAEGVVWRPFFLE